MSFLLDIFHRDPALWRLYNDEANRWIYGSDRPEIIRIAAKEHRHRTRRWTFNGTHWFGKPLDP